MTDLCIEGNGVLRGTIRVSGSKNTTLPLLAASMLSTREVVLHNVPKIRDVVVMLEIMKQLGAVIQPFGSHSLRIHAKALTQHQVPSSLAQRLRGSILLLSPVVARLGRVRIGLPGGCVLGKRPIDWHLHYLEKLSFRVVLSGSYIDVSAPQHVLTDRHVEFEQVSVGTTEQLILAAVTRNAETTLSNISTEPEVLTLIHMLRQMGAMMTFLSSTTLHIRGVQDLKACEFMIPGDRMEAGTYAIAAAATRGSITLEGILLKECRGIIDVLRQAGTKFHEVSNGFQVCGQQEIRSTHTVTGAYPYFPTDLQAPLTVLMLRARGISYIQEMIYESRYAHVKELQRMGANIMLSAGNLIITGMRPLHGCIVYAHDIRASMALLIAALCATGPTTIKNVDPIDRGYPNLEQNLLQCGISVRRLS